MRSSSEVLTEFYKLGLVKGLDTLVNDGFYKHQYIGRKGSGEYLECWLLSNNGRIYVQQGYVNLNLFVESLEDGRPDMKRMEYLTEQIHILMDKNVTTNIRFQIEQESGVMDDKLQDKMFFINFKFNFQTI